jgi:hypothetical protein
MDYEILTISRPLLPNGIIDPLFVHHQEEHDPTGHHECDRHAIDPFCSLRDRIVNAH